MLWPVVCPFGPVAVVNPFDTVEEALGEAAGKHRIRGVITDITALDREDPFGARNFRDVALMVRMRGARMVIVGIQPEVAFAMVQLGLTLSGVSTALDLEEGLAYLNRRTRRSDRGEH